MSNEDDNTPEFWQFRKQRVDDWNQVTIPKNSKEIQIVNEDEPYTDYNINEPQVLIQKVHYVIWLEKVV